MLIGLLDAIGFATGLLLVVTAGMADGVGVADGTVAGGNESTAIVSVVSIGVVDRAVTAGVVTGGVRTSDTTPAALVGALLLRRPMNAPTETRHTTASDATMSATGAPRFGCGAFVVPHPAAV